MTSLAPVDAATFRRAVRADLLEVLRIERAVFPQPWTMDAFEQFLGEPGFLVAELPVEEGATETAIAGYVLATGVRVNGRPMGHVKDLAVASDSQGRGLGSALLERALALLSRHGYDVVRLEVRESNEPALALYRGYGFEQVQIYPEYYPDGEDALILHAPLDRESF